MKRIVTLALLLLFPFIEQAQPTLQWTATYNGPPDLGDEAVSIAVDAAGNSYVTGSAFAANGSLDIVTFKYNPLGQVIWMRSFNGSDNQNDQGTMLVLDNAGNVYVTGYTYNTGSTQDITTIKYNTNGVLQWVQYYDGAFSGADYGNALAVDPAGNVYVTGSETTAGFANDWITLKYSATGMLQWFRTYNGPGGVNDEAKGIVLDVNGNVYVAGSSDTINNSTPLSTMVLFKYDNNGNIQWRRCYNNTLPSYSYTKKLAIDRNNNLIVIGYGGVTNQGNNMYTFEWDSSGVFRWFSQYNFGPNLYEQPNDVVVDSLNNVIVVGQGIGPSSGSTNDYVTVKYDENGVQQWSARYNNIFHGEDRATAAAVDDSLNVYVTGFSKGTGTQFDIATIKYDAAGNQQYVLRYDNTPTSGDDAGNDIAVRNGDIYITGKSANATNDDYFTARYSYGIPTTVENMVAENSALKVFPNPVENEFHVVLPGGINGNINGEILNEAGQTVFVSEKLATGEIDGHSVVTLQPEGLAAGIYFVQLYSEEKLIGNSMFVVK